jgi:hypothetical protein
MKNLTTLLATATMAATLATSAFAGSESAHDGTTEELCASSQTPVAQPHPSAAADDVVSLKYHIMQLDDGLGEARKRFESKKGDYEDKMAKAEQAFFTYTLNHRIARASAESALTKAEQSARETQNAPAATTAATSNAGQETFDPSKLDPRERTSKILEKSMHDFLANLQLPKNDKGTVPGCLD